MYAINTNYPGQYVRCIKDYAKEQIKQARLLHQQEKKNIKNNQGHFIDSRDGKVYKTIKIGNQTWMAENLAFKPDSGSYWAYDNKKKYKSTFGYLYEWKTAKNACPKGWHIPTDEEWAELIDFLGGTTVAGYKLKEPGSKHWYYGSTVKQMERNIKSMINKRKYLIQYISKSGFSALAGGGNYRIRYNDNIKLNIFSNMGYSGSWWSTSENHQDNQMIFPNQTNEIIHNFWTISIGSIGIYKNDCAPGNYGLSVRCIKDK